MVKADQESTRYADYPDRNKYVPKHCNKPVVLVQLEQTHEPTTQNTDQTPYMPSQLLHRTHDRCLVLSSATDKTAHRQIAKPTRFHCTTSHCETANQQTLAATTSATKHSAATVMREVNSSLITTHLDNTSPTEQIRD
jgi:GTP-binding protein EngB required for normal cell division